MAAKLFEYRDTLATPFIACRVDLTYGVRTYTLDVDVPRDDLLGEITPDNLAEACEQILGFPVNYDQPAAAQAASTD